MITGNIIEFIGVAATAIDDKNATTLEVYCPEMMPFTQGVRGKIELGKEKIKLQDVNGVTEELEIELSDTITCEYLGKNSNASIPDIHIGEYIVVWNFAGAHDFFWTSMDKNSHIRHTEHHRLSCADLRVTNKPLTDDNTYYIEIDTKYAKHIKLSTSKTDGEAFRYFIDIDAKTNTIEIKDDDSNIIKLDSNIPRIYMENKLGTICDLNAPDAFLMAPNNVTVKAGNHMDIIGEASITLKTPKLLMVTGSYVHNSKSYVHNSDAIKMTTGSYIHTSKEIKMSAPRGYVTVNGLSLGVL